jgi:hypothetical protein
MQVEELLSAGMPPIIVVAEPGVQGLVVTGMQGMGVRTPRAAAVADATVGLAMDMHAPKVGMFVMGTKSMMLAAGAPQLVRFTGRTMRDEGATPKEHIMTAPAVTSWGIGRIAYYVLRIESRVA